jgi:hypothetical protein
VGTTFKRASAGPILRDDGDSMTCPYLETTFTRRTAESHLCDAPNLIQTLIEKWGCGGMATVERYTRKLSLPLTSEAFPLVRMRPVLPRSSPS